MIDFFSHSPYYPWLILPLFIFFARICDVSLGTIRIIFITRGMRNLAPLVGFVEIFIWLLAISQIMQHLNRFEYYLAYAAGFASGTYVGMFLENKLAIGVSVIRIIAKTNALEMVEELKALGYSVTSMDAKDSEAAVQILFAIVPRKDIPAAAGVIKACNPQAVYTIEDVRSVSPWCAASFPGKAARARRGWLPGTTT